eukprot:1195861-Rhodomonas_salina.2
MVEAGGRPGPADTEGATGFKAGGSVRFDGERRECACAQRRRAAATTMGGGDRGGREVCAALRVKCRSDLSAALALHTPGGGGGGGDDDDDDDEGGAGPWRPGQARTPAIDDIKGGDLRYWTCGESRYACAPSLASTLT